MASDIPVDKSGQGVEKRVVGGEEQYSFWVPMSATEAEALRKKAEAENVNVRYLIANLLRAWLAPAELSDADLDGVVGGAGEYVAPTKLSPTSKTALKISSTVKLGPTPLSPTSPIGVESTVMCAW